MKHHPARIVLLTALLLIVALATTLPSAAFAEAAPADAAAAAAPAATDATDDKDERSAAERRTAGSEFEREKLDQGAFVESEKEAQGSGESSGGGSGALVRALFGLVVVLALIYGVHWLLKRWGQSRTQGVAGRTGIIDVVATTTLAQGRSLHLVRVGPELVLVGATENSITRIGEVDASAINSAAGNAGNSEFQSMLNGAMIGSQPGVPSGMGGSNRSDPLLKRVMDNLRMSTAR